VLLWDFLTRKQLYLSFLLSDRQAAHKRTSCCSAGYEQGHAGGTIAGTEWELPAGSSVQSAGKVRAEAEGCLKATPHLQHSLARHSAGLGVLRLTAAGTAEVPGQDGCTALPPVPVSSLPGQVQQSPVCAPAS